MCHKKKNIRSLDEEFIFSLQKFINSSDGEIIFAWQKKIYKFIGDEIIYVSQKELLNHYIKKVCVYDTENWILLHHNTGFVM